tara:strand:+ start:170 stop:298 length:129 start_codon:yes stop_codon:yes gene_type:complete
MIKKVHPGKIKTVIPGGFFLGRVGSYLLDDISAFNQALIYDD